MNILGEEIGEERKEVEHSKLSHMYSHLHITVIGAIALLCTINFHLF